MNTKGRIISKISYLVVLAALFVFLYYAYQYYQTNNFNDFVRSETNLYTSNFKRDVENQYDKKRSYKIESPEFNDAMFYKTIAVKKNQPYKVTCMVKTSGVEAKEENSGVGAQISIEGSTERSVAISKTQDWQKIELLFNAKDRESIKIGFRLGGYLGEAKGEAWFANFTIEEGSKNEDNNWKFACFIFQTTDVTIQEKQIKLAMTQTDSSDIKNTIKRFESSSSELADGKMTTKCDIYQVDTPLSKLSYDEQFGYYVAPEDVEEQIKQTVSNGDYDHIFVIVRLGNEQNENAIEVNDWIGLRFYGLLWSWFF